MAEAAKPQAAAEQSEKTPPMIDNPQWLDLDRQRAALQRRHDDLLVDRTVLHPAVQDVAVRIEELQRRVEGLQAEEVILALGSDVEGEATANYIADLLADGSSSITRLAQGMPAGGGLDHVDELTLFQALSGRRKIGEGK